MGLEVLFEERYKCSKCTKKYPTNGPRGAKGYKMREGMGCFGPRPRLSKVFDEFKITDCPGNHYHKDLEYWLELHAAYKNGVLPFNGLITDQPCKIIEIFNVIDGIKATKETELHDREMEKLEKDNQAAQRKSKWPTKFK